LEADSFLDSHGGGANLLKDFLASSSTMFTDTIHVDINLLSKPYHDFSWIFLLLIGQESTSHIPRYVLYVLYLSFENEVIFDWDEIISNEIFYKLSNYLNIERFCMTSYLVLVVAYCNVFEGLPSMGNVDVENNSSHLWYPVLWKHKEIFHFC